MLCLCAKDPNNQIDVYKDFVQLIRKKELIEPFIMVVDDTSEKLKEYVQLLLKCQMVDGSAHIYYGEVKKIISSFLTYYTAIIDDVITESDAFTNEADREDMMDLIESTINAHQTKQVQFGKSFLPVNTPWEKKMYEEIEKEYEQFMMKLVDIKDNVVARLDRQCKVQDFAKEHFPIGLRRMADIFDTAHLFLGTMLADRVPYVTSSLEEILRRLRVNLATLHENREEYINQLLYQLYERNKESMAVAREFKRNSVELAEATRGINSLRNKIESHEYQLETSIERLETEVAYWSTKLDYFREIGNNLTAIKKLQEETYKERNQCQYLRCKQIIGCNRECKLMWRVLYSQRVEEIRQRIINETRALITYFAVRGTDRILYTDNIGPHYVDEFNHQNYVFDYGLHIYHMDCGGEFVKKVPPDSPYLFDEFGRYIIVNGEKFYQNARCTSMYKLNEANYFEKVTKDCGHSEKFNKNCHMDISDPTDVEILPDFKPIDIKKTLPTETVRYLWDCFGCVLPEALHDVGQEKPKNPIHFLAHKILYHKYRRTKSELQQQKDEAEQYRANIFNERKGKKKVEAASKLKSHQAKRRKPEESDDTETRAAYDAMVAQEVFIMAINQDYGN